MSSSRELRTYASLCRAAGYDVLKTAWAWYDPARRAMREGLAPEFNGVPWLVNGLMESENSSDPAQPRVYVMVLGDDGEAGPPAASAASRPPTSCRTC
jgi:hypothetical protein